MKLPLNYIWQPSYRPSKQLVIVLHGRGDSAEGFSWLQEELGIDPLNYLLLTAPTPYYTGYSWYDLAPHQLPGILESRRLLAEVLTETAREGYAQEETFLVGFSQGCLMTLEFGARYEQPFAGYVGISGYCHDPQTLLKELNPQVNKGDWLVTHGTEDEMLPVSTTRQQIQTLNAGGFRIDYREFSKAHTIDPEVELPQIREWIQARCRRGL